MTFLLFNLDDILIVQTNFSGITMHFRGRNSDGVSQILLRTYMSSKSHTG